MLSVAKVVNTLFECTGMPKTCVYLIRFGQKITWMPHYMDINCGTFFFKEVKIRLDIHTALSKKGKQKMYNLPELIEMYV